MMVLYGAGGWMVVMGAGDDVVLCGVRAVCGVVCGA